MWKFDLVVTTKLTAVDYAVASVADQCRDCSQSMSVELVV